MTEHFALRSTTGFVTSKVVSPPHSQSITLLKVNKPLVALFTYDGPCEVARTYENVRTRGEGKRWKPRPAMWRLDKGWWTNEPGPCRTARRAMSEGRGRGFKRTCPCGHARAAVWCLRMHAHSERPKLPQPGAGERDVGIGAGGVRIGRGAKHSCAPNERVSLSGTRATGRVGKPRSCRALKTEVRECGGWVRKGDREAEGARRNKRDGSGETCQGPNRALLTAWRKYRTAVSLLTRYFLRTDETRRSGKKSGTTLEIPELQ